MKIERKGVIKAPINLVFECLTNIDYFRKEILIHVPEGEPKLQYNRKNPFGINKKIRVLAEGLKVAYTVIDNKSPNFLKLRVSPEGRHEEAFGVLSCSTRLENCGDRTAYHFVFESSSELTESFKVIAWVVYCFAWLGIFKATRRFVKYVESKKV